MIAAPVVCLGASGLLVGWFLDAVVRRTPVPLRHPATAAGTGLLFAGATAWYLLSRWTDRAGDASVPGTLAAVLELLAYLYLVAIGVVLALIDLGTRTLPDRIVLPAYAVGAVLLGSAGTLASDGGALLRASIGAVGLFLLYLVVALLSPRAMGLGDVKLAGVIGLFLGYLGWPQLLVGAVAAFVLGGAYATVLLAARRASRTSGIPFGPWMLLGAWVGIVPGPVVAGSYLSALGLA